MSKHTERGSKYLKALYTCYNKYWDEMRDKIPANIDPTYHIWATIASDVDEMVRKRHHELNDERLT